MNKTTVIIPSRNEELYLNKTIQNVLDNAAGDIEIIPVLDGWEPSLRITDKRVVYIKHEKAIGQRHSINEAARIATGNFVMKLDAHCAVGPEFDAILMRDCEYDMTMIPAMFNLDVKTWKPKYFDDWDRAVSRGKLNPYMFIGWKDEKLRALYYGGRQRREIYEKGKSKPVDETMCCMGPSFFMHKERFWELGGCDENHGHWGQQGVEVACKAWLSGGRLMTNKNTWFAHFFRGGGVPEGHQKGFPYHLSQRSIDSARKYSTDLWTNNKWPQQTRTFEWLVNKFNPPGASNNMPNMKLKNRNELIELFRDSSFKKGAEIGVAGGKFSKFMHDTIPDLELLSVDDYIPHRIHPEKRMRYYREAKKRLFRYVGNTLVRSDSIEAALKVPDESLDFVYIDADHTFNGVAPDICIWAKKVRKGGIVSGHDYVKGKRTYGVIDAVDMYVKHNKKELFLTENDGSGGSSWYFYK